MTLANVTVSGNSSEASGGGIHTGAGSTTLNNVTVALNTADSADAGNGMGGGLSQSGGEVASYNTIIASNSAGDAAPTNSDCSGTIISGTVADDADGHNLVQYLCCGL